MVKGTIFKFGPADQISEEIGLLYLRSAYSNNYSLLAQKISFVTGRQKINESINFLTCN